MKFKDNHTTKTDSKATRKEIKLGTFFCGKIDVSGFQIWIVVMGSEADILANVLAKGHVGSVIEGDTLKKVT